MKINIKLLKCIVLTLLVFTYISNNVNAAYYIPEFVKVGLINNYSKQNALYISNKSIAIGYNPGENFTYDAIYTCENGFRFENNTSSRMITASEYANYQEVVNIISGSNNLLPVFCNNGKFKIATKPSKITEGLDMVDYPEDAISIVMIGGDNKEKVIFQGENYPLFKSCDEDDMMLYGAPLIKFCNSSKTPGRFYRGYIQIYRNINMTAVNYVNMDEYLYSVAASEMSDSWPIEALKAQVVTARTFALKKIKSKRYEYYDLVDTTNDQVYTGYKTEGTNTQKAANETSGEVLVYVGNDENYKNTLVETFFFSTSGGITEESQNVWVTALPYLKSVKDTYEKENKYYNWKINFNLQDLANAVSKAGKGIGIVTGCTVNLAPESGRVVKFNIIGTAGTYSVSKDKIRTFFTTYMGKSLNSTNFELYNSNSGVTKEEKIKKQVAVISNNGLISYRNLEGTTGQNNETSIQISKSIYSQNSNENKQIDLETISYVKDNSNNLAKGEYLIIGNGWGHGVGMSQYGARDMANIGFSYKDILKFYYTDVEIQ